MKTAILLLVTLMILGGCVGGTYQSYSTNDVPLASRRMPTHTVLLIKHNDPQPDPATYIVLGKIEGHAANITVFERRGRDALNLLRGEAMKVGADAVIGIQIGETQFGSIASGWAIRFKK